MVSDDVYPKVDHVLGRVVPTRVSQLRGAAATGVPERQDLYAFGICDQAVIDVVTHSREVQTTHAREGDVPGASADLRLN